MCGIAGFLLPRTPLPRGAAEARLWAMLGTLRHRGPDDEGVWTDGRAGLAPARRSQQLILARDRIGKKPLYYARTGSAFLFGSEIKAVLAWPDVPRAPDLIAIDRYLTLGYVPAGQTSFAGIEKLPAAHYLVLGL